MARKITKDIDLGAIEIRRQANKLKGSYVKVGLQGVTGQKPAGGNKFNEATVVDVGIFNEFGTAGIPSRSFMRSTYDNKNRIWSILTKKLLEKIILRRINSSKALSIIGLQLKKDIQRKIRSNVPPPNAESTIAMKLRKTAKGSKGLIKTLIDTGRMLGSITFVKVMK